MAPNSRSWWSSSSLPPSWRAARGFSDSEGHPHRRLSVAFSCAHRHGRRVVRFSRMSKLIYITNASLDGYIEDKTGAFDWGNPDHVFDFITELMQPIGTHLLGRRLYETM